MNVEIRQTVERAIVTRFLTDALAVGYSLNVDNGGGEEELPSPTTDLATILMHVFVGHVARIYLYGHQEGWVDMVYGNDDSDVISDYMMCCEPILAGALKLADMIKSGDFHIVPNGQDAIALLSKSGYYKPKESSHLQHSHLQLDSNNEA